MTLKKNKTTEDYVVVAPKISRQCATQLQTFATAKGVSLYEAMQTENADILLEEELEEEYLEMLINEKEVEPNQDK